MVNGICRDALICSAVYGWIAGDERDANDANDMNRFSVNDDIFPARRMYRSLFLPALIIVALFVSPGIQAQTPAAGGQNRVAQIQQLLASEGFTPGPPDGLMGTRTVQAIIAFQRREGLPQTGRPDLPVLERLQTLAAARAAPSQPTARQPTRVAQTQRPRQAQTAAPASSPAPTISLSGSRWELIDESGSRQTLAFLASGKISDTADPAFWKWRVEGQTIEIEFDTGAGGWVRRSGKLSTNDRIDGTATSSLGNNWRWTARRLAK